MFNDLLHVFSRLVLKVVAKRDRPLLPLRQDRTCFSLKLFQAQFWTDVRNGHLNFSNEWIPLLENRTDKILLKKEFANLIKDEKVKILVIKEKKILEKLLKDSFFEKCDYEYGSFEANHATRNIFFSGVKKYNWIYFKNFDLNECLKNE